jgi:O-antigen/teichoic acid export membrane protein
MVEAVNERQTIRKEVQTAARHMAVYGLGGLLVKALGFLMLPFYTRYLYPVDYGVLEILDLSMSVIGLLLNMGLIPAFLRCYASAEGEQEKRTVVSTGCLFGFSTGIVVFLAGSSVVHLVSGWVLGPGIPSWYLLMSFSTLILTCMANLPRTYLRALEQSGAYTIVDTLYVLLLLVLNVFFIAVLKLGVAGMLWSSLVAGILQFVLLSGWALRKAGVRFHFPYLRQMLSFGLPLIFSNLALFVLNFSDRFFLQHLQSLQAVGVYAVGYKFGYMLNYLVVQPFFIMWQSRMYAIRTQPEHAAIYRQLFSMYSMSMIYLGLAMSLFSPETIRLMVEPKFAASQDVIPIVVLAYVFYGISYYAQLGIFLTEKTGRLGYIGVAAALLNLGANYVLVSRYGMMGAAWATLFSFLFVAAASYWCSQSLLRLPLGVGRVSLGIALAVACYLICRTWTPDPGVAALVVKSFVLVAFPVVVWKSGILLPSAAVTVAAAAEAALGALTRMVAGRTRRATDH